MVMFFSATISAKWKTINMSGLTTLNRSPKTFEEWADAKEKLSKQLADKHGVDTTCVVLTAYNILPVSPHVEEN